MTKTRNMLLGLGAAAILAACAGVSLAQSVQTPAPAPRAAPEARAPESRMAKPDPAKRADALRSRLKLTPAQEPALQAWLTSTAPKPRGERPTRPDRRSLTTPQRLDQQLAMMNERNAAMKTRIESTKRFYGALTAPQKTEFDQMSARMGRDGGRRMAMGPRGGDRFEGRGKDRGDDRRGGARERGGRDNRHGYQPG